MNGPRARASARKPLCELLGNHFGQSTDCLRSTLVNLSQAKASPTQLVVGHQLQLSFRVVGSVTHEQKGRPHARAPRSREKGRRKPGLGVAHGASLYDV